LSIEDNPYVQLELLKVDKEGFLMFNKNNFMDPFELFPWASNPSNHTLKLEVKYSKDSNMIIQRHMHFGKFSKQVYKLVCL
jgi:hypothetical protein